MLIIQKLIKPVDAQCSKNDCQQCKPFSQCVSFQFPTTLCQELQKDTLTILSNDVFSYITRSLDCGQSFYCTKSEISSSCSDFGLKFVENKLAATPIISNSPLKQCQITMRFEYKWGLYNWCSLENYIIPIITISNSCCTRTSPCASGYSSTGSTNSIPILIQNSVQSNLYHYQAQPISKYFNMPDSCKFSQCSFVSAVGTNVNQGQVSQMVTVNADYSSQNNPLTFVIDTSKVQSQQLYLSCAVPQTAVQGSTCGFDLFYVYSSNTFSFEVQNCYIPKKPDDIILQQNQNGGSVTLKIDISSIMITKESTCTLSCQIVNMPSYITLSTISSTQYQLVIDTKLAVASTQLQYNCSGQNSDSFTFQIVSCTIPTCAIGYQPTQSAKPSSYQVIQYSGTLNQNRQNTQFIAEYFTIPETCRFSECILSEQPGSSMSQGQQSTMVNATYDPSSNKIQFSINTSIAQSKQLYLSCTVPSKVASSNFCAYQQFYVLTKYTIDFIVLNCNKSDFLYTGINNSISFNATQYDGIQNRLALQQRLQIDQYIKMPFIAFRFSSCSMVTEPLSPQTVSTMIITNYIAQDNQVQFYMDTSSEQTQTLYLSCIVPIATASGTSCASSQFSVYSDNPISFSVVSCFQPLKPTSYMVDQGIGVQKYIINVSSFIKIKYNSCSLNNCRLEYSALEQNYFPNLTQQNKTGDKYILQFVTNQIIQSFQIYYSCLGNGYQIVNSYNFSIDVGCSNTTIIQHPNGFSGIYYIINEPQVNSSITISNFTSFLSKCPILKHELVISKNSQQSPSFVNIKEGQQQFTITNVSMDWLARSYQLCIYVQFKGGGQLYQPITIQIINNCRLDSIFINNSQIRNFANSIKKIKQFKYSIVNSLPIILINTTNQQPVSINITNLISNIFSISCPLIQYQISKVQISSQFVDSSSYGYYFELQKNGIFKTLQNASNSILHSQVYIQAFNGQIWGGDTQQYLIDVTITDQNTNQSAQIQKSLSKIQNVDYQQDKNIFKYLYEMNQQIITHKQQKRFNQIQKQNVTWWIQSIDRYGLVTIQFGQKMNTNINISHINSTNTYLFIQQPRDSDLYGDLNDNFNWTVVQFNETKMLIQLNFSNPLEISTLNTPDFLYIYVNGSHTLLKSLNQNKTLDQNQFIIYNSIKRQVINSYLMQIVDQSSKGIAFYIIIFEFFLLFLSARYFFKLLLFIRALQIQLNLPIFQIQIPGNALLFIEKLMKVVMFDLVQYIQDWTQYSYWKFDKTPPSVSFQMITIGYDKRNVFQALVTGSLLMLIYYASFLISLVLKVIIWKKQIQRGKIIKIEKFISRGVFFDNLLKIIIEGIIEILIFSILNYKTRSLNSIGEIIGLFQSELYFILITAIFIIIMIIGLLYIIKKQYLKMQLLERYFSILYKDQKNFILGIAYTSSYLSRRLIYVALSFSKNSIVQIVLLIAFNLFFEIVILMLKAQKSKELNKLDFIYEILTSIVCMHLAAFQSEYVSIQQKYNYGWSMIFFIALTIAVNIYYSAIDIIKDIRSIFQMIYNNKDNLLLKLRSFKEYQYLASKYKFIDRFFERICLKPQLKMIDLRELQVWQFRNTQESNQLQNLRNIQQQLRPDNIIQFTEVLVPNAQEKELLNFLVFDSNEQRDQYQNKLKYIRKMSDQEKKQCLEEISNLIKQEKIQQQIIFQQINDQNTKNKLWEYFDFCLRQQYPDNQDFEALKLQQSDYFKSFVKNLNIYKNKNINKEHGPYIYYKVLEIYLLALLYNIPFESIKDNDEDYQKVISRISIFNYLHQEYQQNEQDKIFNINKYKQDIQQSNEEAQRKKIKELKNQKETIKKIKNIQKNQGDTQEYQGKKKKFIVNNQEQIDSSSKQGNNNSIKMNRDDIIQAHVKYQKQPSPYIDQNKVDRYILFKSTTFIKQIIQNNNKVEQNISILAQKKQSQSKDDEGSSDESQNQKVKLNLEQQNSYWNQFELQNLKEVCQKYVELFNMNQYTTTIISKTQDIKTLHLQEYSVLKTDSVGDIKMKIKKLHDAVLKNEKYYKRNENYQQQHQQFLIDTKQYYETKIEQIYY